jgi:hypothetical protein
MDTTNASDREMHLIAVAAVVSGPSLGVASSTTWR